MAEPKPRFIAENIIERYGLVGKVCLVTGGTKGIGKAIVEELAGLGAKVFTCSRNPDDLADALAEWKEKGFNVQGCVADVAVESNRQALVSQVSELWASKLDVLVNNVGTNIRRSTVEYTPAEYQTVMSTNLESAYNLCQLCHPLLSASSSGRIVNITSVAGGPTAIKSGTLYAMTKAALNQLTKNLCCEWAKDGILVNSVAPWYTVTPLVEQYLQDKPTMDQIIARTPLERVAYPPEVSGLVGFLCGPAASYITGQIIQVDGGMSVLGWY